MRYHFGICEWSFPVFGPLAMQLAREAGYEGMQLGEAGGRNMGYPLNHRSVQKIYMETAAHLGLTLHSLNLGALLGEGNLNYAPGTMRGDFARKSLWKGFEVCRNLDIHTIVITVEPSTEEILDNIVSHLDFASKLAKESNVEIAVESAQPIGNILKLLNRVDDEIRICMDLLNPLRFGTGIPQEQIRAFGKSKISHFHMKDSEKSLFQMGQRGCTLLGQGDAGIHESVNIIKELGCDGWFITENYYYLPPMNQKTDDFVALAMKDLDTMKRLFAVETGM